MIAFVILLIVKLVLANHNPTVDSHKDQSCTDPRTMMKHAAYTEWADAYSCTRHRCQPGGRNLAIYTVGCKRVEAPESAIECEEVVEDTNMQFPYCCTRLRCLVLVRGEVWTRVLGQPWETLPAAPWSHMYKMKKPPPGDVPFIQKNAFEGPVYELSSDTESSRDKTLRTAAKKAVTEEPCKDVKLRTESSPDIVIALSTKDEDNKEISNFENIEHKNIHKTLRDQSLTRGDSAAVDESLAEKPENSEPVVWTEIPQNQWPELDRSSELDVPKNRAQDDISVEAVLKPTDISEKVEKASNLQALVDAIGNRMRDIENVVQKMSEKVQQAKPGEELSVEKKPGIEAQLHSLKKGLSRPKKANPDGEQYKRFTAKNRSKYLRNVGESTTEQPLFVEDSHLSGYFSDGSNSLLRRAGTPKEPMTYMAPVDSRRKVHAESAEAHKKRKHAHKKKHKSKPRKKHHKDEKRKINKNKINSVETERVVVSLEDSSAVVN